MDVNGYLKDASGSAIGNATAAPLYVSVVGGSRILPLGATGNILWFNGSGVWATVAPPTTNYNYVTYSTTSSTVQWSTISHYQISDLQGGTTGQYYHLTSAQQASVSAWNVATASHNHNIWQLTGYSTQNADTVDNFHATSFIFATTASATGCLLQYVSGTWASLQPGTTQYQVLLTQATGATCYWGDLDCGTSGSRKCAFQLRRDTALNWYTANPTLMVGGVSLETDTHIIKTGDGVTAYNSLGFPIVPYYNYVDGDPRRFTLSQLAEAFPFIDDFSNNTIGQYTTAGSPSISGGELSVAVGEYALKTLNTVSTTGKWTYIVKYTTTYGGSRQDISLGLGSTTRLKVHRAAANAISTSMYVNGVAIWEYVDSTQTLADNTYIMVEILYDGGNCTANIYGMSGGSYTKTVASTATITTPSISVYAQANTGAKADKIDYMPPVAFSDSYASDTEARYHQLQYVSSYVAADAGDVVVSGGKMSLIGSNGDEAGIAAILRSYNFKSGEIEASFKNTCDGGGGADQFNLLFGCQDIQNLYALRLEDDTAGAENLKLYKKVAGSWTQLGTTKNVSSTYTRGNKTWLRVQWDSEKGRIWAWLRDDAGTYPTTPDISDAFSSAFSMGKVGVLGVVTTAGAGNLSFEVDDLTIRCNCLVGETNVPATETGFYLRSDFSVNESGRWTRAYGDSTITYGGAGGKLTVVGGSITRNVIYLDTPKIATCDISIDFKSVDTTGEDKYFQFVFGSDKQISGSSVNNGYAVSYDPYTDKVIVYKYVSGAGTALNGSGYSATMAYNTNYTARVVWTPSAGTIAVYLDGALLGTVTDTTYTAGGYIGIRTLETTAANNNWECDNLTISGTRYYNKPMLRGAQIGEWWDGSKSVYGTRFTDDYDWNSIGEYTGMSTSAVDTTNGYLTLSDTTYIYPTGPSFSAGSAHVTLLRSAASGSVDFTFCNNVINITYEGAVAFNGGAAESWSVDALSSAARIMFYASGTSMEVWSNGVLKGTKTGLTLATSNFKMKRNTADFYVLSLQVNGYDSTAKLGLNLTLGGVPHGARYDTQEYAALSFTNRVKYGTYKLVDAAKCTATSTTNTELYFANSTDSATISTASTFTLTFSATGTTTDFVNDIMLLAKDRNDTITLQARRQTATTDNSAAVFIEYNALVPLTEVATV